jgi:hypothetical protein
MITCFAVATKTGPERRVTFEIWLNAYVTGFSPNLNIRSEAITLGRSFKGGNNGYNTVHYWDYDFQFTNGILGINGGRRVTTSGTTTVETKWRTDIYPMYQSGINQSQLVLSTLFFSAFYDRTGHSHRGMDASRADRWAIMQPCQ